MNDQRISYQPTGDPKLTINHLRIGFYTVIAKSEEQWLLGALLITDDLGKPEEFRVTYPVRPSQIQRQLYGESLIPHVAIDLCGKPLLQALRKQPDLMVITSKSALPLADYVKGHLILVESAGETLVLQGHDAKEQFRDQKIHSPSGRFQPINLAFPPQYLEADRRDAAAKAAKAFEGVDLLEPFKRIEIAISTLASQDERFR
jgi:hypothetical protein